MSCASRQRLPPYSPRNLLFLDFASGATRWLLEDHEHIIDSFRHYPASRRQDDPPPLAALALVKPEVEGLELASGRLLLMTPDGARVTEVANDVRRVNRAKASDNGVMSIIFERDGDYILARHDLRTLAKLGEQRVQPPLL